MAYEFWGPRLPRRTASQKPARESTPTPTPAPPASSKPAALESNLPENPDPATFGLLADWARSERERLEARVEVDIWRRIKDRLPAD